MRNFLTAILVGLLSLGLATSALAGMNHRPHSVKTFMGKDREAKTETTQTIKKAELGERVDIRTIKPYIKAPISTRKR